ncbi:MAG TPA: biliverdin-producing heme oxygenase [Steroidobacteraceae bacterium]|nr:biliverdin-producing heme oxygenase [Steroidobacteraceae bacterium]
MNAIAQLRAATKPAHQRLEKRLDVKTRFSSLFAYRAHLERMWGFCAGLEQRVNRQVLGDALADYDLRRKLPLLARDLVTLGAVPDAMPQLPRCEAIPVCPDVASGFGCLYVLEGATLGGRTLLPLVQEKLGLSAGHGAAFLASYGADVAAMWQRFGAALDAWCCTPERQACASYTAVATFDALQDWLCGSTP